MSSHTTLLVNLLLSSLALSALACSADAEPPAQTVSSGGTAAGESTVDAANAAIAANPPSPPASPDPMATEIQVVNRSAATLSRSTPCSGDISYKIGIRPAEAEPLLHLPTCVPVNCADLSPTEVVPIETECSTQPCGDRRHDLAPEDSDVPYTWNGVYASLTDRNCYESLSFEPGTPMLAHVCYGTPSGDFDIVDFACEDHPFAYGQSRVDIELR